MILDPNRYRYTLDKLKYFIINAPKEEENFATIALLSLGSHVPIAAVISYALRPDVLGPSKELETMLEVVIHFYKYAKIEPWHDLL